MFAKAGAAYETCPGIVEERRQRCRRVSAGESGIRGAHDFFGSVGFDAGSALSVIVLAA